MAKETKQKKEMTEEEMFQNLRLLEAVLFTSQDLVTEKQLEEFFDKETDINLLLTTMQEQYANRGVNLVKRGAGWGLRTSPDMADRLQVHKVEIKPMSRAAVETLAIVAYHQPVTRAEVEQIRGVNISKSTFEILVEQNLIKPGQRRDVPGRPLTWITTRQFLDTFGLESLKQLPNLQELKEAGLLSMQAPQLANMPHQPSLPLAGDEEESMIVESEEEFEAAFEEGFEDEETSQGEAA